MSTIDVRKQESATVTSLVFSDFDSETEIAYKVEKYYGDCGGIKIKDEGGECVVIRDKEHADNLIKALSKAAELGWLK